MQAEAGRYSSPANLALVSKPSAAKAVVRILAHWESSVVKAAVRKPQEAPCVLDVVDRSLEFCFDLREKVVVVGRRELGLVVVLERGHRRMVVERRV